MKNISENNVIKSKSVIVDGNLHSKLKEECDKKSMKIGGLVEGLIKLYLNNPKEIQKLIADLNN